MTEPNDREQVRERMRELGRRSGEVRRERAAKRAGRGWSNDWLDDLPAIAREVRATGNGLARVRMTEIALEAKRERLAERERDLDERERQVSQREREADDWEESARDWEAWEAEAQARYEAREIELSELVRRRDALMATIAREAGEAGFELVEDEEEDVDVALA